MDQSAILRLVCELIGGLGLFLLGMKHMSEGLQAIAGSSLRRMISAVTNHRTLAVLVGTGVTRSEEHTSELQSRRNLVCRLLLEKKNGLPILARYRMLRTTTHSDSHHSSVS